MSKRKRADIGEVLAVPEAADWRDVLEDMDAKLVVRLLPRIMSDFAVRGGLAEGLLEVAEWLRNKDHTCYPLLAHAVVTIAQACQGEHEEKTSKTTCTSMWEVVFDTPREVPSVVQKEVLKEAWLQDVELSSQDVIEINLAAVVTVALHAKGNSRVAMTRNLWTMKNAPDFLSECLARLVLNLGAGEWVQEVASDAMNTVTMNKAMDLVQETSPALYWKVLEAWVCGRHEAPILRCLRAPPKGHESDACELLSTRNLARLAKVLHSEGMDWPLLQYASKGLGVEVKVLSILHDIVEDKEVTMDRYREAVAAGLKVGSSRGSIMAVVTVAMFPEGVEADAESVLLAIGDPNAALICTLLTAKAHEGGPRSTLDAGTLILTLCGMETSQLNWNSPEILFGSGGRSILTSLLPQTDLLEQISSVNLQGVDTAPLKGVKALALTVQSLVKLFQYKGRAAKADDTKAMLQWLDTQLLQEDGPLNDDTVGALFVLVEEYLPRCVWDAACVRERVTKYLDDERSRTKGVVLALLAFRVVQGDLEKGVLYSELLSCPLRQMMEQCKGLLFYQQLSNAIKVVAPHVLLKSQSKGPAPPLPDALSAALEGEPEAWYAHAALHPEVAYISLLKALWDDTVIEHFLLCPRRDGEVVTSVYLPEILTRVRSSVLQNRVQVGLYLDMVEYYITAVKGYGKVQRADAFQKVRTLQNTVLAQKLMTSFEAVVGECPEVLQRLGATLRLLAQPNHVMPILLTEGFSPIYVPCFTQDIMNHALVCLADSSLSLAQQRTSFDVIFSGAFPAPGQTSLSQTLLSLLCTLLQQITPSLTALLLKRAPRVQAILAADSVPPERCLSLVVQLSHTEDSAKLRKMLIGVARGLKEY